MESEPGPLFHGSLESVGDVTSRRSPNSADLGASARGQRASRGNPAPLVAAAHWTQTPTLQVVATVCSPNAIFEVSRIESPRPRLSVHTIIDAAEGVDTGGLDSQNVILKPHLSRANGSERGSSWDQVVGTGAEGRGDAFGSGFGAGRGRFRVAAFSGDPAGRNTAARLWWRDSGSAGIPSDWCGRRTRTSCSTTRR